MRMLIVASLLASVAVPSAALAAGPFGHRGNSDTSSSSNDGPRRGGFGSSDNSPRVQRSESAPAPRSSGQERPTFGHREAARPQQQQQAPQGDVRQAQPNAEARQAWRERRQEAAQQPQAAAEQRQAWRGGRQDRAPQAGAPASDGFRDRLERNREARRDDRAVSPRALPTNNSPVRSRTFRNGRDLAHAVWQHHDWRNDRRYDWRDYRQSNWSLFHFGYYNDPYGYGYNRFQIGWSLWPSYYQSSYWLDDPWQYRLPPAYGPYRWVRYWDDALLVDIYTGEVVDVVYDFFW